MQHANNQIQSGNAGDTFQTRGWLVGHFVPDSRDLRHSQDVEIKWGIHKKGEARSAWAEDEKRTTIALLVSGEWEMIFRDRTVKMSKPGDYVMWGIGTDHKWRACKDSVIITIRWFPR